MSIKLPKTGDNIKIISYKHNGKVHRIWEKTTVLYCDSNKIIGGNTDTQVTEADGKVWRTKGSAIVYFSKHNWFNVVALLGTEGVEYYCNLSSPLAWNGDTLSYIDYDLDISVKNNGTIQLLDKDEYLFHRQQMNYPEPIVTLVENGVKELEANISAEEGFFNKREIAYWAEQYNKYINE